MRSAQKNNRSRGRGNRKGGGGGGGGGNIINRVYDSAGPEGKVRGTPQQIIDKYLSLARDAQTTGDRVMSENFLQHAEHYQRLLMTATAQQEQNRRDQGDGGQDFDGDDREPMQGDRRGPQPQHQPQAHDRGQQPQQRRAGDGDDRDGGRDGGRDAGVEGGQGGGQDENAEEIGGMTMIDSGTGGEDLLVVSEDITQSQPRRNGDGRRRRRQPRNDGESGQQAAESPDQPADVSHEG